MTDSPCKIIGVWFGPDLQLEKNWSEVLEKVVTTSGLWLWKRLYLKEQAEVCSSHIYTQVIYCLSVLSHALFYSIWKGFCTSLSGKKGPLLVHQEICQLYPSEDSLGLINIEMHRHTLHLSFRDQMHSQDRETVAFRKEKKSFQSLGSVYSSDGETHHLPRNECPFNCECWYTLKVLSQLLVSLTTSCGQVRHYIKH